MNFDFYSLRPLVFDVAGMVLIGSVVLWLSYIRYDRPWMAKFAWWGILLGGAPVLYLVLTGY